MFRIIGYKFTTLHKDIVIIGGGSAGLAFAFVLLNLTIGRSKARVGHGCLRLCAAITIGHQMGPRRYLRERRLHPEKAHAYECPD